MMFYTYRGDDPVGCGDVGLSVSFLACVGRLLSGLNAHTVVSNFLLPQRRFIAVWVMPDIDLKHQGAISRSYIAAKQAEHAKHIMVGMKAKAIDQVAWPIRRC